jgi:DNA mismatch repair protein MSH6
MAKAKEGNEVASGKTPAKRSNNTQSKPGPKQQSIAGFFKRGPGSAASVTPAKRASDANGSSSAAKPPKSSADLTPAPSSAVMSSSPPAAPGASQQSSVINGRNKENGMPILNRNGLHPDIEDTTTIVN